MKLKLTLFQARYIQYLTLIGCSLRSTAGHFFERYNYDGTFKGKEYFGYDGNQIEGMQLREIAIEVLIKNNIDPIISVMDNNIGYEEDSYIKFKNGKNLIKT
jgi:hypothetical protein